LTDGRDALQPCGSGLGSGWRKCAPASGCRRLNGTTSPLDTQLPLVQRRRQQRLPHHRERAAPFRGGHL